ncbi:hypothetical protein CCHL11_10247 [Colletotrichum chlorophyti]|uniref:Uncharacterized protein n=1 Tax=Colletotrichum chlorophyti TaxID=708187 RepID=A0A1Q8RL68_9PEZI|nr:hypothetical protein CCHL11_10247 [Colletotrichum chlorophyti]
MQIRTITAGLLAFAATASATPIMGNINMYYDPNSDCSEYPVDGISLAIPPYYIGQCHTVPMGMNNVTYKRFSGQGIQPAFTFELYTNKNCSSESLATKDSGVCVSDIQAYIPRRSDGF